MSLFKRQRPKVTHVVPSDTRRPRKALIIYRSKHDLYGNGRLIRADFEITSDDPLASTHELYFTEVGWVSEDKSRSYIEGFEPTGDPMVAEESF